VFEGVSEEPVVSLLRGFSAPVKLEIERSEEELSFLLANDQDPFNKWEAGQMLFQRTILSNVEAFKANKDMSVSPLTIAAVKSILADTSADPSSRAYALGLPSLSTLGEAVETIDPDALVGAVKFTKRTIAAALQAEFEQAYNDASLPPTPFRNDAEAVGKRRIKNTCLDYLSSLKDPKITKMALDQAMNAGGMTDRVAATAQLAASDDAAARDKALGDFYENHAKGNDLILCKFFTMQAIADTDNALEKVNGLLKHPDFSLKNPNKCRSLVGAFAGNMRHFHAKDGSGYRWLGDRIIEIDAFNPQLAARMTTMFSTFRRYDAERQALIKEQLERLVATEGFSKDSLEIATRSLKG
jgi:aminopeptidase N